MRPTVFGAILPVPKCHQFVFGEGTHNSNQASLIFPDTMRWLWRDTKRTPMIVETSEQRQRLLRHRRRERGVDGLQILAVQPQL